MSKLLKKRCKQVGLPPGTLIAYSTSQEAITLRLSKYTKDTLIVNNAATVDECLAASKNDTNENSWIEVTGVHDPKVIEAIGTHAGLHPLLMEDILCTSQRCKIDDYGPYVFLVMRALSFNEEKGEIEDEQVSLVLGSHFLVSFVESGRDYFVPIRERLKKEGCRLRTSGSDYLCYALLDCLVDNYFLILEKVDDRMEQLEHEVINTPSTHTLLRIQQAKRTVAQLRKNVWPVREAISQFRRMETPLINPTTNVFMQDVYDHTIQAIDTIESFRDLASGMIDIYLSNINQRMNEVMKVLTVVATIFVPITFIASLYGMNLDYMPELHWRYTYPVVLAAMVGLSLFMLFYFRRQKWI